MTSFARATLTRFQTGDHGTFGRLSAGSLAVFSGELPDRGNAPNVSCIPAGAYTCVFTFSPAFRRLMYAVVPVPGRTGIRIHPANLMGDRALGLRSHLYGCIALGERLGWMDGQRAILVSRPAVAALEAEMNGQPFDLEIINGYGS